MRQLSLHASALNDAEYDLYTTSLANLDDTGADLDAQAATASTSQNAQNAATHDDAYYEGMKIGVREVRGWMRGRYHNVSPANIDTILRFFSPSLSQADTLSGGEFFAALRLLVHVENGRDVDRGLAFVQAHPTPEPVPPRLRNNPFSQQSEPSKPHGPHNPFVNRTTKPSLLADSEPTSSQSKLPPLPPRKPPPPPVPPHIISSQSQPANPVLLPPPRHNSTLSLPANPPIATAKVGHITSTLMKQSLQASKAAQTMKRAESQLEQERVLQVLKSSSVVSGGYSLAGAHITRSSIVVGASIQNRSNTNNVPVPGNLNPGANTNTSTNTSQNRSPSPGARAPYGRTHHARGHTRGYGSSSVDSTSSASASEAPPLPQRRAAQTHTPSTSQHAIQPKTRKRPSPPASVSSLEQVALASSSPSRTPRPPSSTSTNNPFHRTAAAIHATSTLVSSTIYSSPHGSSADLHHATPDRDRARPPTHPDRKPFSPLPHPHPHADTENPSQDITVPDSLSPTLAAPGTASLPTTATTATSDYATASSAFASPFHTPDASPTTRVFRSKSLHHHHAPPPPPVRRRRPESSQVLGNVNGNGGVFRGGAGDGAGGDGDEDGDEGGMDMHADHHHLYTRAGTTLSRHASLSAAPGPGGGHRRSSLSLSTASSTHTARTSYSQPASSYSLPPTHAQYTHTLTHTHAHARTVTDTSASASAFSNILASLQPKLDKARYKAEAGLSRRGFVNGALALGGDEDAEEGGSGRGRRRGRGAGSVLSGEEREEREELVVHDHGHGHGFGYDGAGVDVPEVDQSRHAHTSRKGAGGGGGIGSGGTLNGVGGDAVLESDDTGGGDDDGDGDGDGEARWRREVKERWGGGVRDKDELKLPAGEGWRPL